MVGRGTGSHLSFLGGLGSLQIKPDKGQHWGAAVSELPPWSLSASISIHGGSTAHSITQHKGRLAMPTHASCFLRHRLPPSISLEAPVLPLILKGWGRLRVAPNLLQRPLLPSASVGVSSKKLVSLTIPTVSVWTGSLRRSLE